MTIASDYIANIVAARDPAEALAVFVHTIHAKIDAVPDMTGKQQEEIDDIFVDVIADIGMIVKAMQIRD